VESFSGLDWAVCLALLATSIGIALVAGWQNRSSDLLMGRQLTCPLLVATLVATWYGDIFGVTQIAFEQGIYMFLTQGVAWYIAYLSFALLVAKKLRQSEALSLGDLVGRRFGPRSATLVNWLSLSAVLPVTTALCGGVLLQVLFGLPLLVGMVAMLVLAALCSYWSGFRGVVWSDGMQSITICAAVALVVVYSWMRYGGFSFLQSHLPSTYLQVSGGNWQRLLVWGWLAMATTFLSPAFYQCCLAAKDGRTARRGVFIACLVWILFDLCTLTGALYARVLLPQADSLHAYLYYGLQLLPSGLRGLFLAGLTATILSTLDSSLFLFTAIVVNDMRLMRHTSALLLAIAASCALPFLLGLHIESIWLTMHGLFVAVALLPLLLSRWLFLSDGGFVTCGLAGGFGMLMAMWWRSSIEPLFVGHLVSLIGVWLWKTISSSPTVNPTASRPSWPPAA